MIKSILLAILICNLALVGLFSQNLEWVRTVGGLGSDDRGVISFDDDGNILVTGTFRGTADFDPGSGVSTLTSQGDRNAFVLKADSDGKFIWVRHTVSGPSATSRSIQADRDGNIYTTGFYEGKVDLDPGPDTVSLPFLSRAGSFDLGIYVRKMDKDGNFIWAKGIGGVGLNSGIDLAIDDDGYVYVTGLFEDQADFDPGPGEFLLGGSNIWVSSFTLKLDKDGDFVWATSIGGSSPADQGYGIEVDAKGNVYTTGSFALSRDFDPGPGRVFLQSNGSRDIFIQKLDANGNFVWAKSVGGAGRDEGYYLAIDDSNNIYLTGYFTDSVAFDPDSDLYTFNAVDERDVFVQKLDSLGKVLWVAHLGGVGDEEAEKISVDNEGSVYISGDFDETLRVPGQQDILSAGQKDIFVQKLNFTGQFEWIKTMGGPKTESGLGLFVQDDKSVFVGGFFEDTVDFDPNSGTQLVASNTGGNDIFFLKLNANPVGIFDSFGSNGLNIYPNPTSGSFRVELPEGIQEASIRVLDNMGRAVYQSTINRSVNVFNVDYLNSGVYQVQLKSDKDAAIYLGKLILK